MKKILIIKHGSLGDIISSTSAIKPIRDYYQNSVINILTSKKYKNFLRKSDLFDAIIEDNRKGFLHSMKIIYNIIYSKFDLVIDLQNSKRTYLYCFFIRLFSNIKINGTHSASHFRFKYNKNNPPHVIEGLKKQIALLGIKSQNKPFLSWLKNDTLKFKELENKKYFIINPGCSSKNSVKRWSSKKFSDVCKFLVSINIVPVVIGADTDKNIIDEIENYENKILNLYNKASLDVVYNLALNAVAAISNDTGPAHLIAATNCKIHLVLSSFSNVKTVIPQSSNVSFTQANKINDISSKEIINIIKNFLK
tara:strand:+ start:381 stop:1304 length:924 start_codon:yes stop_codon:yes gene_type:complete